MGRHKNRCFSSSKIILILSILKIASCKFTKPLNRLTPVFNPNGKVLGASCSSDSSCKDHLICQFDHVGRDGQCTTGYYNSTGALLGASCGINDDCHEFTRCVDGKCKLPSLAQPCVGDCFGELICSETARCRPPSFGDSCTEHWVCPAETACRNGTCRKAKLSDICDDKILQCGNGMKCYSHICVVRKRGDVCSTNEECSGSLACIQKECRIRRSDVLKMISSFILLISVWAAAYKFVYNSIDNDNFEHSSDENPVVSNNIEATTIENSGDLSHVVANQEIQESPSEQFSGPIHKKQNIEERTPLLNTNQLREQRSPLLRNLVRSISRREAPVPEN